MSAIRHDYEVLDSPALWPEGDGGAVPEQRILSTYEACRWLGVDRTTLKRWAEKTKVRPVDMPYDDRVTGWKESELQHIFSVMRPGYRLKPYAARDESAAVRELRAEVESLRALLESHIANHARARSEGQQPPSNAEGEYPAVARPKRTTVQLVQSRNDTLPPGWMAVERWVRTHPPLKLRTVQRHIDVGLVPEPQHGNWKQGRVSGIKHVWDEEQQAAALRFYQERGDIPTEHINT